MASGTAERSASSSPFTSMRRAWKARLAGWPPWRRVAAGMAVRTISANRAVDVSGAWVRSRSMAWAMRSAKRSSPYSCSTRASARHRIGVHDLGGGQRAARIHAHVQRGVLGIGEPRSATVELHRRDAQIEQHAVDDRQVQLVEHVGHRVVDGMHQPHPGAESGQSLATAAQGLRVTVEPDEQVDPDAR